jgi:hypothetical protein
VSKLKVLLNLLLVLVSLTGLGSLLSDRMEDRPVGILV